MIVGFTITDFNGHEDAAIEYIKKVCILESTDVARNIVEAGTGVNVFSNAITLSELEAQPFSATPIETQDGKYIITPIVNFNLELLYNSNTLRLVPTEYIYVPDKDVFQFETYIRQGLVKTIPKIFSDELEWILETGDWNDNGIWINDKTWRDN